MHRRELQFEDVMLDPHRFGMPTFDEFSRNPDIWRSRPDEILTSADQSSQTFRNLIRKQRYFLEGYRCDSLEKLQEVAENMGINLKDLEMRPQIVPVDQGKCDLYIQFRKKRDAGQLD